MSSATEQLGAGSAGVRIRGRAKRWELPIGARPVTVTRKGSLLGGLFIIVFALFWGGMPTMALIQMGPHALNEPKEWLFLIFPVVGIGILLFGIFQLVWRKTITIDDLFVTVEERGLFGTESWQEQVAAYEGVLSRSRRVSRKRGSYTLYLIDLLHADAKRTISLYSASSDRDWRAKWEAYARWLDLPALERTDRGVVTRDAADLDKPVAELMREGKVRVDRGQLREQAEGVTVEMEGEAVVVTRTGPELVWWGAIIMLLFPLIFVYVGFFMDDVPGFIGWFFGTMGLLFEALILAMVIWDRISRQRLRVDPERIVVNALGPRGETRGKSLAIGEVEQVHAGSKRQDGGKPALIVTGDRDKLSFGRGLPRESLDVLVNLVLAKIAKHHGGP